MRDFIEEYPLSSNRAAAAPPAPDYVDARVLGIATAERLTLPAGARFIGFSANADFYAKFGTDTVTAAVPGSDVTDGTAAELNPSARRIPSGITHVSVIAPAATVITLSYWS